MRIGFLVFEGVEELDLVGPWEMASMWAAYAAGPEAIMVARGKGMYRCAKGMMIAPHHSFVDCPAIDYLLVPGGLAALDLVRDPAIVDFVRDRATTSKAILSVCTGAFILHAAGLLDGREATTHWKFVDALARLSKVSVRNDRWVRDGPIWTSAGVSAGIDMMLAFIAHVGSEEEAATVQLHAEYFPSPKIYGTLRPSDPRPAYLADAPDGRQR